MTRPVRTIDAETVTKVAVYAGLPLEDDRVQMHVDLINVFFESLREWETVKLGYWFDAENGTFGHVPTVNQYRIPWEYPTGLTKNRSYGTPKEA